MPAGSTVVIGAGSYGENVTLSSSGLSGSPTTFEAAAGATVSTASFTVKASHVAISGLTITGASGSCVTIAPALSDVTVQNNQINHCGADGIHFTRPGAPPSSNYTTNSMIVGNTISAVGVGNSSANDITIYANYLTVQGNDLSGTPNDAVDLWGDHLTFRLNKIHDISNSYGHHDDAFQSWTGLNSSGGLCTPGTSGCDDGSEGNPVTNLLVEQNRVTNVLGSNAHAFMLEGPGHGDWTVRDNIIASIGDYGMMFGINQTGCSSPTSIEIYNNTFYNAGANDAVDFNCKATGSVANNIVINGGGGVYLTSGTTVSQGYNIFYSITNNNDILSGNGDKTTDPGLANPSGGDFTETSTSPAINAGDNGTIVNPARPYDILHDPVVNTVDIGAYEYQG